MNIAWSTVDFRWDLTLLNLWITLDYSYTEKCDVSYQGNIPWQFDNPNPQTNRDLIVLKVVNKVAAIGLTGLSELKQQKTSDYLFWCSKITTQSRGNKNWKKWRWEKKFLRYIKLEHKTSRIKKFVKEKDQEKSYPVHVEEFYQSNVTLLPIFGSLPI